MKLTLRLAALALGFGLSVPSHLFAQEALARPNQPTIGTDNTALSDPTFLALVAMYSMDAMDVAKLASQHAQSPELQKLAGRIHQQEKASLQKIRGIAADYDINLPRRSGIARPGLLEQELPIAPDASLDLAYIERVYMNQAVALRLLETAAAEPHLSADMRILANNLKSILWQQRHDIELVADRTARVKSEVSLQM